MPSTLSKMGLKVVGKLPPDWILFYLRMSPRQKWALLGSLPLAGLLAILKKYAWTKNKKHRRRSHSQSQNQNKNGTTNPNRKPRVGVNLEFFKQMKFLLKLMIPSLWSKQIGILLSHTGILMARTFLSIYVAKLEGKIVKEIVER